MHMSEIRNMTDERILGEYEDLKANLYTMRQQHATGELKDTSAFRETRRDIARLLTVLRERELAAEIAEAEEES